MESNRRGSTRVDHFTFEGGEATGTRVLAQVDGHGRWTEWGRQA